MAASIARALTLSRLSATCCRRHFISRRALSTADADSNAESEVNETESLEELQRLEEENLRDISGLTDRQKRRFYGQVPEIRSDYERSVR